MKLREYKEKKIQDPDFANAYAEIQPEMNIIRALIEARASQNMTQKELSLKSGVGLRFVRDLEQGKETLRLDKVNQLLDFFNYEMVATSKTNNQ